MSWAFQKSPQTLMAFHDLESKNKQVYPVRCCDIDVWPPWWVPKTMKDCIASVDLPRHCLYSSLLGMQDSVYLYIGLCSMSMLIDGDIAHALFCLTYEQASTMTLRVSQPRKTELVPYIPSTTARRPFLSLLLMQRSCGQQWHGSSQVHSQHPRLGVQDLRQ